MIMRINVTCWCNKFEYSKAIEKLYIRRQCLCSRYWRKSLEQSLNLSLKNAYTSNLICCNIRILNWKWLFKITSTKGLKIIKCLFWWRIFRFFVHFVLFYNIINLVVGRQSPLYLTKKVFLKLSIGSHNYFEQFIKKVL